jgi:hypothetical protein
MFGLPGGGLAIAPPSSTLTPLAQTYSVGFAGDNQYMLLGMPTGMNFDWDGTTGSGMVWARIDRTSSYQCILGQGYAATAHIGFFLGVTDAGAPYLYLGGVSAQGADGTIVAGNWYMFSWSFSGGVGKFYVNGVQVGSNITIGTETAGADWMVMATRYNDGDNAGDSFPTQGLVSEIAIWNTSLAAVNHFALYNSGDPVSPQNFPGGLIHWWRFGDGANDFVSSSYTIADVVGSDNGTLTNFSGGGALWQATPGSSSNTYAFLPNNQFSCLYSFRANDWAGATNDWTDSLAAYTATYSNGAGSSVKQASSFAGISEATVGDIFTMAANSVHGIGPTSAITFAYVLYTGALDGSGGFYAGSDDNLTGISHVRLFNYFYAKDVGARVYTTAGAENELSGLNAVHVNKYVMVHVVVDVPNLTLKSYVNGTLINSMTLSGTTASYTAASIGFGIMSVFKTGGAHYESTASGQKFIEFTRYDAVLTPRQIAQQAASFNTIKGYF